MNRNPDLTHKPRRKAPLTSNDKNPCQARTVRFRKIDGPRRPAAHVTRDSHPNVLERIMFTEILPILSSSVCALPVRCCCKKCPFPVVLLRKQPLRPGACQSRDDSGMGPKVAPTRDPTLNFGFRVVPRGISYNTDPVNPVSKPIRSDITFHARAQVTSTRGTVFSAMMRRFVILITASSLFLESRESISAYPAFQIRIHAHPAPFKSLCRSRGHILWEALNENRRYTFKLLFPEKVSILHPCFTKRRSGAVGQIPSFDQTRTHDCCVGCFLPSS